MKLLDLAPLTDSFKHDVLHGLGLPRKRLPPKHFYDEIGSELFDRICETPEYYVPTVESEILRGAAPEIARICGEGRTVIEYGSGTSAKTRILLSELKRPAAYVPIDISRDFLVESSGKLEAEYPGLAVTPVCADFTAPLPPDLASAGERRLGFLPGSTFGNFDPIEGHAFLVNAARLIGPGGHFAIGLDLVKGRAELEAAYNDAEGVTARFNLNLLARINRELEGDFDLSQFAHRARFNERESRMEMHLESLASQQVRAAGASFGFARGETIHTESSYKFTLGGIERMAERAGMRLARTWTDARGRFAVVLLETGAESAAAA